MDTCTALQHSRSGRRLYSASEDADPADFRVAPASMGIAAHALTDLERATASSKLSRRSPTKGRQGFGPDVKPAKDVSGSIAANNPYAKLTVAIRRFWTGHTGQGSNRVRLRGARECQAAPVR